MKYRSALEYSSPPNLLREAPLDAIKFPRRGGSDQRECCRALQTHRVASAKVRANKTAEGAIRTKSMLFRPQPVHSSTTCTSTDLPWTRKPINGT